MIEGILVVTLLALAGVVFFWRRSVHYMDALQRQIGDLHDAVALIRTEAEKRGETEGESLNSLRRNLNEVLAATVENGREVADVQVELKLLRNELGNVSARQQRIIRAGAGRDLLHPVFRRFKRYRGPRRPGYIIFDFLPTWVRNEYIGYVPEAESGQAPQDVDAEYPEANEDIFAWIDILEAVAEARGTFRMMELGSAYGCWAARGALAAKQLGLDVELTCVEAEPEHFEWIAEHMQVNSIPLSSVRRFYAALSDQPGTVLFCVHSPWLENCNAGTWHGQAIAHPEDVIISEEGTYHGLPLLTLKSGFKAVRLPVITMEEVLNGAGIIDVIHADLQDAELRVFSVAMDAMDRQVKRINIGTHSTGSEDGLRALFGRHGWECLADYSLAGLRPTPYGDFQFQDGVQSWRNPKLTRP